MRERERKKTSTITRRIHYIVYIKPQMKSYNFIVIGSDGFFLCASCFLLTNSAKKPISVCECVLLYKIDFKCNMRNENLSFIESLSPMKWNKSKVTLGGYHNMTRFSSQKHLIYEIIDFFLSSLHARHFWYSAYVDMLLTVDKF